MKKILCLWTAMVLAIFVMAQQDPMVFSAAGSTAKGPGITLDWTLGEMAVSTLATSDGLLTQGFHQPMLLVEETFETPAKIMADGLQFSVAPNPVSSTLSIRIGAEWQGEGAIELWDFQGNRLQTAKVNLPGEQLEWDLSRYPAALYSLMLRDENGVLLRTFKISKIN